MMKHFVFSVVSVLFACNSVHSSQALTFDDSSHHGFLASLLVGWEFQVSQPLIVTHLGYYDSEQDGLAYSHKVGIFDVSTQGLITSASVGNADPLEGFFHYQSVAPVQLVPGRNYYMAGLDSVGAADRIGIPDRNDLHWDQSVQFQGWDAVAALDLSFPSDYSPTFAPWANSDGYMITSNFQFTTVPAPSSLVVLAAAAVSSFHRRMRRTPSRARIAGDDQLR